VDGVAVRAYHPWQELSGESPYAPALRTLSVDLAMAAGMEGIGVAHSHTWYANFAGHLAKLIYGVPHVMTTHSLEPLRPWKAEQLGTGGYALSSFCERTGVLNADRVIAVSNAMREDVLRAYPNVDPSKLTVIYNGIDADEYRPDPNTDVLDAYGVAKDRPYVLFVGRVTHQKGITHLLESAPHIDRRAQLVFAAGAPDTDEIARRTEQQVERLKRERGDVVWIEKMLEKREVIQLLTHAAVFVVPSVYEPLGIVNLEAMACETPVVASAVGGIPEVVEDGVTGLLVPYAESQPDLFERTLADRINELIADPDRAHEMGKRGRQRVLERFSWAAIAEETAALYRSLL
jgi:starch synthase